MIPLGCGSSTRTMIPSAASICRRVPIVWRAQKPVFFQIERAESLFSLPIGTAARASSRALAMFTSLRDDPHFLHRRLKRAEALIEMGQRLGRSLLLAPQLGTPQAHRTGMALGTLALARAVVRAPAGRATGSRHVKLFGIIRNRAHPAALSGSEGAPARDRTGRARSDGQSAAL